MQQPDTQMATKAGRAIKGIPSLTDEQWTTFLEFVESIDCKKGETLFQAGDDADSCFIIAEGTVAVKKETGFGNSQVIGLLSSNAPVGEQSLIAPRQHSTTVIVVENARLLRLRRNRFSDLRSECPEIAIMVLEYLLRAASARLERCSARLAHIL